jgi:hypothetical protein
MAAYDPPTKLHALGDHFQAFYRVANYLLVAHAAGFAACLSTLKDYNDVPQLKGIGGYIVIFGLGLLLASLFFGALTIIKVEVTQRVISQDSKSAGWRGKILSFLSHLGMWGSIAMFILAVVSAMQQFGSL